LKKPAESYISFTKQNKAASTLGGRPAASCGFVLFLTFISFAFLAVFSKAGPIATLKYKKTGCFFNRTTGYIKRMPKSEKADINIYIRLSLIVVSTELSISG